MNPAAQDSIEVAALREVAAAAKDLVTRVAATGGRLSRTDPLVIRLGAAVGSLDQAEART